VARDVVTDVSHAGRTRLGRKKGVERGDPVGLGGRHAEAPADVVESAGADPADAALDGVQRRKEEVTLRERFLEAAPDHVVLEPLARKIDFGGDTDDIVYRRSFGVRRLGAYPVEIHL
jgi:hypothetical protein